MGPTVASNSGSIGMITLAVYTVLFVLLVTFFEIRLNILHKRYIEKVWPIGQEGLEYGNKKFRFLVRLLFALLYVTSAVLILSIL